MSLFSPRPRRRLTPILAEDMSDSWSLPPQRDQLRIVIDRERPLRSTNQPLPTPPRSRRRD